MNLDDFITEWVNYADCELDLNLNYLWGTGPRYYIHTKPQYKDMGFLDEVKDWEPLYHPIVAMQEAEQRLDELSGDLNKLWNESFNAWIKVFVGIHGTRYEDD